MKLGGSRVVMFIFILLLPVFGIFYLIGNDGVDHEVKSFLHPGSYVVGKDFASGLYKLSKAEFNGGFNFRVLNKDRSVKVEKSVSSKYYVRLQDGETLSIDGRVNNVGFQKIES